MVFPFYGRLSLRLREIDTAKSLIAVGNALGETTLLRERWLRQVFHEAAVAAAGAATAASDDAAGDSGASGASVASGGATTPSTKAADDLQRIPVVDLDQDAAIALLKEINADLATGRIKQKMAVRVSFEATVHVGKPKYRHLYRV